MASNITRIEDNPTMHTSESQIESSIEKGIPAESDLELDTPVALENPSSNNKFLQWTDRIENFLGLEARGIHRVQAIEQTPKTTLSFINIVVLWFSINTACQNITLASIGQSVYGLGFVDATLCSVLGAMLGSVPVAYTAGWGPWSGNRTMVSSLEVLIEQEDHAKHCPDLCTFLHGLVACQDLRSFESGNSHWIFDDRCCCCRPNVLRSISQWQFDC